MSGQFDYRMRKVAQVPDEEVFVYMCKQCLRYFNMVENAQKHLDGSHAEMKGEMKGRKLKNSKDFKVCATCWWMCPNNLYVSRYIAIIVVIIVL